MSAARYGRGGGLHGGWIAAILIFAAFCIGWQVYHFGIEGLMP